MNNRFMDRTAASGSPGVETTVTLKWFNPVKGFGFVVYNDQSNQETEAFLHVSALQRAGAPTLYPGAEMVCEVGDGPRGSQVTRIVQIMSQGDPNAVGEGQGGRGERSGGGGDRGPRQFNDRGPRQFNDRAPMAPAEPYNPQPGDQQITGTVKWYKFDKGFGFATGDGSDKDIFIHRSALARSGVNGLEPGQAVRMTVRQVDRGLEALVIESQ